MLSLPASGAPPALSRFNFSLLLAVLLSLFINTAAGYTNCSSFATNGSAASQYDYYRFYDFRNISSDKWDDEKDVVDPNNVTAGASTSDMSWQLDWIRRDAVLDGALGENVLPINYDPSKVAMRDATNSPNTALGFLSSRVNNSQHQSSGLDFTENQVLFLSLRVYARVSGAAGACAAFFTYKNDSQEADIELLTRDADDMLGFNTQPTYDIHGAYINGSHFNITMPEKRTREDWVLYRLDWVEDEVVWFMNGVEIGKTTVNVPTDPSHLYLTMWGNGGTWTGNMTLGESALLEVQYIEVAYNLSGARPVANESGTICNLDEADTEGNWQPYIFPEPHDDTSDGYRLGVSVLLMLFVIVFTI